MSVAPNPPSATLAQRFGLIIRGLLQCVGARATMNLLTGGYPAAGMVRLPGPMAELICARFRSTARQFAALAERVRLGTVRTFPTRASPHSGLACAMPPADQPDLPDPAAPRLPRRFGGVLGLLYWEAAHCADQVRQLLSDPEMVALLRSAPGFARIVRPLCRMLAIVPPPGLFPPLPRRPRRRRPRADIPPAPSPHSAFSQSASAFAAGLHRPGIWTRPRPAAWETRLEARLAGVARKTS